MDIVYTQEVIDEAKRRGTTVEYITSEREDKGKHERGECSKQRCYFCI